MSLTDATVNSVNAVFAQLVLDVGVQEFADTAYSMGITSPLGVTAHGHPCMRGAGCYIPPAAAIGGLTYGFTRIFGTGPLGPILVTLMALSLIAVAFARRAERGAPVTAAGG